MNPAHSTCQQPSRLRLVKIPRVGKTWFEETASTSSSELDWQRRLAWDNRRSERVPFVRKKSSKRVGATAVPAEPACMALAGEDDSATFALRRRQILDSASCSTGDVLASGPSFLSGCDGNGILQQASRRLAVHALMFQQLACGNQFWPSNWWGLPLEEVEDKQGGEKLPDLLGAVAAVVVSGRRRLRKATQKLGPTPKRLFCGAFAGMASRTAVAPLELIRTRLMVGGGGRASVPQVFWQVVRQDGWRGLFRGNGVNVLRVAPSKALELYTVDAVKALLNRREACGELKLPLPPAMVAGACGGMVSTICTYPLELMKTRLTVQGGVYTGILSSFARIVREEGWRGLYKGLGPSLVGVAPYGAANYYAYDYLKSLHAKATGGRCPTPGETLVMGSLAGVFASTLTFPLEVTRKRMQLGGVHGQMYKGLFHAITTIVKDGGVRGLYQGLGPSCLKLMPAAGISFMCYEILKRELLEEELVEGKTQSGSRH